MEKQKKILDFKGALFYSLGIFGIQVFIGYINSYQSQFYTSILGAELTICAVIILIAKIISSFADPIIGNIIDSSNFKGGKMKPFVKMSAIPLAAMTTLMFVAIDFKSEIVKYAYITVTTVLWNIIMSFADIPSQGMLPLLTPIQEEKDLAASISNIMKSVALCVASVVIPVVCVLTGSEAIGKKEYFITALVCCVIGLALYAVMLGSTKEVVKSTPNKMSIKEMLYELKDNKMLLIVFLMFILGFGRNIAMNIGVQTAAILFDTVNINIGSLHISLTGENLPLLLGASCAITSATSLVIAPIVNKKLGEKKTYIIFAVYGFVISTVAYLVYVFGGEKCRGMVAILIFQFLIGLMFGTHTFTPLVMLTNIVEYREMKTGKRTEGVQYAVLSLAVKLSNALSVAVGIFMIGLSGYKGTMTYAEITPHMQNIAMATYWLVPGISTMLSAIPVFFYVIDDNVKAEIKQFIASKK